MGQRESRADRIQRTPRNGKSALCDSAKQRTIRRERVSPAQEIGHSAPPRITVFCGTPFLLCATRELGVFAWASKHTAAHRPPARLTKLHNGCAKIGSRGG